MYSSVIFVSMTVITLCSFSFARYVKWGENQSFTVNTEDAGMTKSEYIKGSESLGGHIMVFWDANNKLLMKCTVSLFKREEWKTEDNLIGAWIDCRNCENVMRENVSIESLKIFLGGTKDVLLSKKEDTETQGFTISDWVTLTDIKIVYQLSEGFLIEMKFPNPDDESAKDWIE